MPIYEYQALNPDQGCLKCRRAFEAIQTLSERPLIRCPECGGRVRKIMSRCRAAVVEPSDADRRVTDAVKNYESQGMFSHAAELADKHSEKTRDKGLKTRALDNYKKAGWDAATLDKFTD